MGRQVRRVALDFAWPMNKPYDGFMHPAELDPVQCPVCEGSSYSPEGREMHDRWWGYIPFSPEQAGSEPFTIDTPGVLDYARRKIMDERAFYDDYLGATGDETARREGRRMCGLWNATWQHHLSQQDVDALLASGEVLAGLTHRWNDETRTWVKKDGPPPTQREVNIWGLNLTGGVLSVPGWAVQKAEAERRGVSLMCSNCDGEGSTFRDDAHREAYESWTPSEPPEGEGWQLWETVSEGSPISPVCPTAESLARHMAHSDTTRDEGMGYEGWLKFITGSGWSPSNISVDGGPVMSGHVAMAMMAQTTQD